MPVSPSPVLSHPFTGVYVPGGLDHTGTRECYAGVGVRPCDTSLRGVCPYRDMFHGCWYPLGGLVWFTWTGIRHAIPGSNRIYRMHAHP